MHIQAAARGPHHRCFTAAFRSNEKNAPSSSKNITAVLQVRKEEPIYVIHRVRQPCREQTAPEDVPITGRKGGDEAAYTAHLVEGGVTAAGHVAITARLALNLLNFKVEVGTPYWNL